jgi:hypothetical protein
MTLDSPSELHQITEGQEDSMQAIHICVYTDGSNSEYGVGSGIAIFTDSNMTGKNSY